LATMFSSSGKAETNGERVGENEEAKKKKRAGERARRQARGKVVDDLERLFMWGNREGVARGGEDQVRRY